MLVLKVRVVGEGSPCAQLDSGQQLLRAGEGVVWLRVLLDPLHQVHRVRVVELPQVLGADVRGDILNQVYISVHLHFLVYDGLLVTCQEEDDKKEDEMPREVHHSPIWGSRHLQMS